MSFNKSYASSLVRAVVTMADGSVFVFDYGMLNPKNLISQINS